MIESTTSTPNVSSIFVGPGLVLGPSSMSWKTWSFPGGRFARAERTANKIANAARLMLDLQSKPRSHYSRRRRVDKKASRRQEDWAIVFTRTGPEAAGDNTPNTLPKDTAVPSSNA